MRRNCYFGASALSPFESAMIDFLGEDHVMWGSDYPHEEGTAPHTRLALRWALHDQPVERCRKLLAGNAARVDGFDLDALACVAAEVGPSVGDTHTPLGDTGYQAPAAFGSRPFEGGLALERLAPARPVGDKIRQKMGKLST